MTYLDVIQSIFLGVGLAMDASSVALTDTLVEHNMKKRKMFLISILFGLFQGAMPLIGYFLGSLLSKQLSSYIPIIGFVLLAFLGGKMLFENFKKEEEENKIFKVTFKTILIQAVATSIDALTTGLIYIDKKIDYVLIVFSIVAFITFIISLFALILGKKISSIFSKYSSLLGGIILISIGFKIILESYFYIYLIVLFILLIILFIFKKVKNRK